MKKIVIVFLVVQMMLAVLPIALVETLTTGVSMLPVIDNGDTVLFSRSLPSNLTGEIIKFWTVEYECNVVHRVIADNGTHIQTRGDNNLEDDWFFTPKELISGVYLCEIPITLFTLPIMWIPVTVMVFYFTEKKTNRRNKK